MQPVKLGVIGCGVIGKIHLGHASAAAHIDVVAVADLQRNIAQAAAEQFNVPRVYGAAEELLADAEVEAVVLAMPAFIRTKLALAAFARGKHVLTEKPVAMNADEVRRMIDARGALTAACCSSRFRSYESAKRAAEFVASGELGPLRVVRCRAVTSAGPAPTKPPPVWRLRRDLNGGGIMSNWGCYDLDYLLGVCNWTLRPQTVFAHTWQVAPHLSARAADGSNADTHVAALVRCDGGTVLTLERGEFTATRPEQAWEIIGEKGALTLAMSTLPKRAILHHHADPQQGTHSKVLWEGEEDPGAQHAGPVSDFCHAIREQRPPRTSLEHALVIQQITDAIYRSSETGQAVSIA